MNVFIIHGSYGKPFENWFPWIERELSKRGITCCVPTFPTPTYQNYNDWKTLLDYYCDKGFINEETILIGHSCGAICATRYLCEKKIKINSLITVSGYNNYIGSDPHIDGLNSSFYCSNKTFENIQKLTNERISYISTDDPFITQKALRTFSEAINSQLVVVEGAGHFNEKAGYTEFSEILNYIVKKSS